MSRTRTRIKCSGCGKRISNAEPDLMLQRFGSEKVRYYHYRCAGAAQQLITRSALDAWHLTNRYVDEVMN